MRNEGLTAMSSSQAESRRGATSGLLAPDFMLPDVAREDGAPLARLRVWRQRRPVLMALLPTPRSVQAARWLRALATRRDDLEYAQAVTMVVAHGPVGEAHSLLHAGDISFPLLADRSGETLSAYLGDGAGMPALVAIDRYNALIAVLRATDDASGPDIDAALREFAYAEQQDCACTAPAWEV